MSKAGKLKQANLVEALLTQANRVAEVAFVILVTVVMLVSVVMLVTVIMLQLCRYVTVVLQISYQIQLNIALMY